MKFDVLLFTRQRKYKFSKNKNLLYSTALSYWNNIVKLGICLQLHTFLLSVAFIIWYVYDIKLFYTSAQDKKVCYRWLHSASRVKRETRILPIGGRCL